MSLTAIADEIGCTRDTIQKWKTGDVRRVSRAIERGLVALHEKMRGCGDAE